jgi:O-methyltransferase domain/Dimerisation domain
MSDVMTPADAPPRGAAEAAAAGELIFRIGTGYILSRALQVAVHLRVADHLSSGPHTAAELAKAIGVNEDALYRVLRALASAGVFAEIEPRRFALTPPAALLRTGEPESLSNLILWISDPFHFRVYADAMHSMKTGQPAVEKTFGVPVFEHFARDPELSAVFNDAMTTFSGVVISAALKVYDFTGVNVLVDVAGGHGAVLTSVLGAYPQMRGILFDLDHVIAGAVPRIERLGLKNRCQTVAGDFFTKVPAGGDAYIMKHIIHDWDDERSRTILKNIRVALEGKPNGRVIVLESVLEPGNAPDLGKLIDIEMLMMTSGKERTAEEFAALFASGGFEMTRIVRTESPLSVIEARPR